MPSYKAPVKDMLFLLNDVIGIEKYANLSSFANASPDLVEAVLEEAGKFCEDVLAPINLSGDQQGCIRHADGSVTTPEGFKEAYKAYCDAG
ncbi:MAG: acyl-CoA dehydrogenase N-terminal domain-containing protein, partial [Sphingopyxis sp.]|nr:acyl-CoA dehydrogenase N-terminal domain-containing protein [Sphingopyxis sp.]